MSGPYGMDALFSDWDRAVRASPMVIRNELGAMMDKAFVRLLAEPRFVDGRRRPGSIDRLRVPRQHPTKGFRGAHKLFRGGSR